MLYHSSLLCPLNDFFHWNINYEYVCLSMKTYVQVLKQAREAIRFPGTRITGGYEMPDMGTGNWTRVLYKTSPLNYWAISPTLFLLTNLPLFSLIIYIQVSAVHNREPTHLLRGNDNQEKQKLQITSTECQRNAKENEPGEDAWRDCCFRVSLLSWSFMFVSTQH